MLFVDLGKLKIVKDYRPETFETELKLDNWSFKGMKARLNECFDHFFNGRNDSQLSINYVFTLNAEPLADEEENADNFLTFVNLLLGSFFQYFCLDEGRKREHRLDIPAKLYGVNCSRAMLKKAINSLTIRDRFNITINWGDLHFVLVDSKDFNEDEVEFVHNLDELEVKGDIANA